MLLTCLSMKFLNAEGRMGLFMSFEILHNIIRPSGCPQDWSSVTHSTSLNASFAPSLHGVSVCAKHLTHNTYLLIIDTN